jgi:hypothetical protein
MEVHLMHITSTRSYHICRALVPLMLVVAVLSSCQGADQAAPATSESEEPVSEPAAADLTEEPTAEASEVASEPMVTEAASPVAGDVNVVLGEWVVEPDPPAAPAGSLTIVADDQGGEDHELVIVRADDPADLPTDEDGAVDEEGIAQEDFIGEIEDVASGTQRSGTFTLDPGTYVFFCNVVEEEEGGEVESHFAEGMHATFTAE